MPMAKYCLIVFETFYEIAAGLLRQMAVDIMYIFSIC